MSKKHYKIGKEDIFTEEDIIISEKPDGIFFAENSQKSIFRKRISDKSLLDEILDIPEIYISLKIFSQENNHSKLKQLFKKYKKNKSILNKIFSKKKEKFINVGDEAIYFDDDFVLKERKDGSCILAHGESREFLETIAEIFIIPDLLDSLADGRNQYSHDRMHDLADYIRIYESKKW